MKHRHDLLGARDLPKRRLRATAGETGRGTADRLLRDAPLEAAALPPASARASPSPMPEAPTESRCSTATVPMVSRSRSNTASMMAAPMPCLARSASLARTASAPRVTGREIDQADLGFALPRQHPHQIGIVHRVERMILQRAFVQRHRADKQIAHDRRCGRFPGMPASPARSCRRQSARSASMTGPILPLSVESKVEQILNST